MKQSQPTKITVNGMADPMCPTCDVAMYGCSSLQFGARTKIGAKPNFKHFARCPQCNYETEAK